MPATAAAGLGTAWLLGFTVLAASWAWGLSALRHTAQEVVARHVTHLGTQAGYHTELNEVAVDWRGRLSLKGLSLARGQEPVALLDEVRLSLDLPALWRVARGQAAQPVKRVLVQGGEVHLHRRADGRLALPGFVGPRGGPMTAALPLVQVTGVEVTLHQPVAGRELALEVDYADLTQEKDGELLLGLSGRGAGTAELEGTLRYQPKTGTISGDLTAQKPRLGVLLAWLGLRPGHPLLGRYRTRAENARFNFSQQPGKAFKFSLSAREPSVLVYSPLGVANCASKGLFFDGKNLSLKSGECVAKTRANAPALGLLRALSQTDETPVYCRFAGGRLTLKKEGPQAEVFSPLCRAGTDLEMELKIARLEGGLLWFSGKGKVPSQPLLGELPEGEVPLWIFGKNQSVKHRETFAFQGAFRPGQQVFHANVSRLTKGMPESRVFALGRLGGGAVKLSRFTARLRGQTATGGAFFSLHDGQLFARLGLPPQALGGQAADLIKPHLPAEVRARMPGVSPPVSATVFSRHGVARVGLVAGAFRHRERGLSGTAQGAAQVAFLPGGAPPILRALGRFTPEGGGEVRGVAFGFGEEALAGVVAKNLTLPQAEKLGLNTADLPQKPRRAVARGVAVYSQRSWRGVALAKAWWDDLGETRVAARGRFDGQWFSAPWLSLQHRGSHLTGVAAYAPGKGNISASVVALAASYDALPLSASVLEGLAYFPVASPLQAHVTGTLDDPQVVAQGRAVGVWGFLPHLAPPRFQGPSLVREQTENGPRYAHIGDPDWTPLPPPGATGGVVQVSVSWQVGFARGQWSVQGQSRLENPAGGVNEGAFGLGVARGGELAGWLSASVGDLTLLAPQMAGSDLGGVLLGQGEISGTLKEPTLRLAARDRSGWRLGADRAGRLRGTLVLSQQGVFIEGLTLREKQGSVELSGQWSFSPDAPRQVEMLLSNMDLAPVVAALPLFSGQALPPGLMEFSGQASGRLGYVSAQGEAALTGSVTAPALALGGQELGALNVRLSGEGDSLRLELFELSGSALLVRGEGLLGQQGGDLRWRFENAPLALAATVVSLSAPIGGLAHGDLRVITAQGREPELSLSATVDQPSAGALGAQTARVRLAVAQGRVGVQELVVQGEGGEVRVTGEAPLSRHGALSLSVVLSPGDLSRWVRPLPPDLSLSLPASGEVAIHGTPSDPVFDGLLTLQNPQATVSSNHWPLVEGGVVRARFAREAPRGGGGRQDEKISKVLLKGELDRRGAQASLVGEVNLTRLIRPRAGEAFLSASLGAAHAPLDLPDLFEGHGALNLTAHGIFGSGGVLDRLRLSGVVDLDQDATFYLQPYPLALQQSQGLSTLDYDVAVNTHPVGMEIRGPARTLSMVVKGGAQVRSAGVQGPPTLEGQMRLRHGELLLLNNRFVMEKDGLLNFRPLTGLWPDVDIKARARVRGRDIAVALKGPLNEIQLPQTGEAATAPGQQTTATALFSATPSMSQQEILALLLRRDLVEGALETGDFSAALRNQLGEVAGVYTSALFSQQGRRLGFESLDVTLTENNDLFLLLEREVRRDFLVHYEQKFDEEQSRLVSVKWRFAPGSFLTTAVDHQNEGSVFLEHRQTVGF